MPTRIYASLEDCIKARQKTAELSPGDQYITYETCSNLINRSTFAVSGGFVFTHDSRLKNSSHMYLTEAQCYSILKNVTSDVLLIQAEKGWPQPDASIVEKRLNALKEGVDRFEIVNVKGSHHCHSDEDGVNEVAVAIKDFFSSDGKKR